jgi:NADPH:quinone reductase-like Zn-dependent oxidoreductase
MRAALARRYGSPDVLTIEDVEKPAPANDQVLIRVRAVSLNPRDYYMFAALYLTRSILGLRAPKEPRLGIDLAGVVESVGGNVTAFKTGDKVFGVGPGALAEYACASENKIALMPANASFEQAAAVPIAGLTALQGLRDRGRVHPGQRVVITGASGGVGTFAVQIAKSFGAHVTAVCSTSKVNLVRSLGADQVIDYTRDDFTRRRQQYDVIFDCVGNLAISDCRRALTPHGMYIGIGVREGGPLLGPLPRVIKVLVASRFGSQKIGLFLARIRADDLTAMKELIETGKVKPIVDRCFPLEKTADAFRYLHEGHPGGKVVVAVAADSLKAQVWV